MIKVMQFGEGNFLRTFVDVYFDNLNKQENGDYGVYIVKPITFGTLDKFRAQNNKYSVVLRGMENGKAVENVYNIDSLKSVIDPFECDKEYYALAEDEELKIIVSNTTEAGICFNGEDKFDAFDGITYPAKLTKFLFKRYEKGLPGLYLLPVELIDNNADELKKCVDKYIELWNLPEGFKKYNDTENFYCNTLVDRIVSGYPRDNETKAHLTELIGHEDGLMSIGEPFGLWVIEDKGNIRDYIKDGMHNIEVILTDDIKYYKKRKVRVLNGSHTNLVPAGILNGAVTVYDCMTDAKLSRFVDATLKEEIIPYVSDDIAATTGFAESVKERFLNPFLNHQLSSIALNSISKWRARDLCTFSDYYNDKGVIPHYLTIGFSYMMAMYSAVKKDEKGYYIILKNGNRLDLIDTKEYFEHFISGGSVKDFMANADIFGEDLTKYNGFLATVEENIKKINNGECLI